MSLTPSRFLSWCVDIKPLQGNIIVGGLVGRLASYLPETGWDQVENERLNGDVFGEDAPADAPFILGLSLSCVSGIGNQGEQTRCFLEESRSMRTYLTASMAGALVTVLTTFPAVSSAAEYRTIDGSQNNLLQPSLGQTGRSHLRKGQANYADSVAAVDGLRPNPRQVSNAIFHQSTSLPDPRGLSEWVWAWGQFLDHDIDHTLTDPANGVLSIPIPADDPTFAPVGLGGTHINVSRSDFDPATGTTDPRQQINNITPWIDASNVYGGRANESSMQRTDWLRIGIGGRMKVTDAGSIGDLLPLTQPGAPEMAHQDVPSMGSNTFVAGDVRANEHTVLLSIQTLFVREHNRLAGLLASANPAMGDEELFQRARKIVGAELQAITYHEFLPALGVPLDTYTGHDSNVDPRIATEFASAGYRMGHSQVRGVLTRIQVDGQPIAQGHVDLADAFFNPTLIYDSGLEPLFRGLAATTQESTDAKIANGLRNQLFMRFVPGQDPNDPGQVVANATDLASINITRGRDHGLPFYNDAREDYGLSRVMDFSDVTSNMELQLALESVYTNVNELDLWVGVLAEDPVTGSSLGADRADDLKRSVSEASRW